MVAQVNFPEARQFHSSQSNEALAGQLYDQALKQSLWTQVKKLFGQSDRLMTLAELSQRVRFKGQESGGVKKVVLNKIVGTVAEGRVCDFDINFRPLQRHNRERWISVAAAWIGGRRLGRVKLVQVGDDYFVDDGHHRISVARAMGETEIEASVVVLLVTDEQTMPSQTEGATTIGRQVFQPGTS